MVRMAIVPAEAAWVIPHIMVACEDGSFLIVFIEIVASPLPMSLVAMRSRAIRRILGLERDADTLIIIPTLMRKSGTRKLLPMKWILDIREERCGTSPLRASPHT